jgi:hypothetical protein
MHLRVFDAHAINRSVPETAAQGENSGRGRCLVGHFRKSALVKDKVRSDAVNGHRCPGTAGPKSADFVAKVS